MILTELFDQRIHSTETRNLVSSILVGSRSQKLELQALLPNCIIKRTCNSSSGVTALLFESSRKQNVNEITARK